MDSKPKAVRAGHKSAVKRLLRKTEDDSNLDNEESAELLETLIQKQKIISALDEDIMNSLKEEDIEEEILNADEYKFFLNTKIRHLRKTFANKLCTDNDIPPHDHALPSHTFENINQHSSVPYTTQMYPVQQPSNQNHHLPKLTLPMFNGEILTWQTFWDSFESSVHYNVTLTDVQKFSYLKSQLVNDAARTIDGLPLTNSNYMEAIKLLKERFGQSHKITNAYMQAMLELRAPQNNLLSLRGYYDKLEAYIRGLESLGRSGESYGALLIPIILNKLPSEIRQHLARENGSDNWELIDLRRGILKEITIIEAGQRSSSFMDSMQPTAMTASFLTSANRKGTPSKEVTFDNRERQTQNIRQKPCIFCQNLHDPAKCPNVTNNDTRLSIVKEKKLCFNCLGSHRSVDCKSKFRCRQCHKKHHTSLCHENTCTNDKQTSVNAVVDDSENTLIAASFHSSEEKFRSNVLLKTAVAPVGENRYVDTHILFDEGAQRSFVTEELASKIDLEILGTETIHLSAFGSTDSKVRHLSRARVYVESINRTKIPVEVLVVPNIASPLSNYIGNGIREFKYLKGLRLAHPFTEDNSSFEISLLIGADFYWDFVEDTILRGNGPTAVKSKLGYLLSGPIPTSNRQQSNVGLYNILTSHKPEESNLERFWKLESLGIDSNTTDVETVDYMGTYQKSAIEFRENKYIAKLPWKPDHEPLPTNFFVTKRRTENVIRKLSQDPKMLKVYGQIINDQERRGFIEKVKDPDISKGIVHYIPHHPVKKDSTTTPIRIVYDCSCRQSSQFPSLNDCLMNTPPILNDLTKILIRFRLNPVAIVTDIEKAFLHVGLHEQDRDVTRFLWLDNPVDPQSDLATYRFKSVLFGATCSPFILNAVLLKHLQQTENETTKILTRDLYVDNILSSICNETQAVTYFKEVRQLMLNAGFNLRSWTSNNENVRNLAIKEDVLDTEKEAKILGMRWNVETDELSYAKRVLPSVSSNITKREILKESSKLFDPLGFLSPVSIRAKILMQDLWKERYDWDEPLPENLQSQWKDLAKDIGIVTSMKLPRQYFTGNTNSRSLHVFVDASMKAYGAVAYMYLSKGHSAALVMAKTRVAPVKKLTLPQLELMAAVIGARLTQHLKSTLECTDVTLWSDSQIVLQWLNTSKPLKRFVSNRIKEINELTEECKWKYCPTNCNPADLLTRGITAKQFMESVLWKTGPTCLIQNSTNLETHIPINTALSVLADDNEETLDEESNTDKNDDLHFRIDKIINAYRYGSYEKLLRVTTYVQRFIQNCKTTKSMRNTGELQPDELQQSTILWIRCCQATAYPGEVRALTLKNAQKTKLPRLRQLQLYLDENNLMRCKGRIHNAPLSESAKHPYILPANHRLSELIVLNSHELVMHSGVNATVTQIRQTFWIPSLRQFTRKLLHRCTTCKKVNGKPYRAPDPPPLQKIRLQEAPPFTVTGIDFTAALQVKENDGTLKKVYICLFTCASTRAVHLEIIPTMNEESFLLGFRRFTSRKSLPQIVMSDNALSFISASQEVKRLCESKKIIQVQVCTIWSDVFAVYLKRCPAKTLTANRK